jgi:hypothetical protein
LEKAFLKGLRRLGTPVDEFLENQDEAVVQCILGDKGLASQVLH